MATDLLGKAEILADLWMSYRNDQQFSDFIEYNDLGLPLSYAFVNDLIKITQSGEALLNETFELLLEALNVEDTGFVSLDDLLDEGSPGS